MSGEVTKRELLMGKPDLTLCDNRVSTAKYTILTFLPIAIREQFRRNGNIYFLFIGFLMAIGYYANVFQTAVSPWTTLGPLAVVICFSLAQEGAADLARHRSDNRTNQHPCVVINRSDEVTASGGKRDGNVFGGEDLAVRLKSVGRVSGADPSPAGTEYFAFEQVKRMNIRAGHLVLVRNRDMVPADLVLLASSGDGGNAYIETSSIDGETNLKLRTSPHIPLTRDDLESMIPGSMLGGTERTDPAHVAKLETLEQAVKRIVRISALAKPDGESALLNPVNPKTEEDLESGGTPRMSMKHRASSLLHNVANEAKRRATMVGNRGAGGGGGQGGYIAALTSEPPNASVNTYSGKLTLPPFEMNKPSPTIALGAENILLRGAILRNTEWAIGLACFTGKDTKLVMNSFQTPSKFSRLDESINQTVFLILFVMLVCVLMLAALSVRDYTERYDEFWYLGYGTPGEPWPYFPDDMAAPDWDTSTPNFGQQTFLFITLLNNFVPLSLYVTVEVTTLAMMLWVGSDKDMYHEETDTPALARSTIVSDLGQVRYVFSDKTGTLTQNIMRFKRCSVDGMAFGAPVEKSAPGAPPAAHYENGSANGDGENANVSSQSFHPLRQLLLGAVNISTVNGGVNLGGEEVLDEGETAKKLLTFNAEMFLRVMSICHTVVVEKNFDANMEKDDDDSSDSKSGFFSSAAEKLKLKKKKDKPGESRKLEPVSESDEMRSSAIMEPGAKQMGPGFSTFSEDGAGDEDDDIITGMSDDGAPIGHQYQAESPDEGALVSAASLTYGFQFLGRDSSGVKLACSSPSLLSDEGITSGLKRGTLTPKALSAETASPVLASSYRIGSSDGSDDVLDDVYIGPRRETWAVLAVNKFDSDRKRMSVLVRSPPELGSVPMLLCKGADSSMLDSNVCNVGNHILPSESGRDGSFDEAREQPQADLQDNQHLSSVPEELGESGQELSLSLPPKRESLAKKEESLAKKKEQDEWETAAMLGIQAHLGDFASEGLRTLVLGVRFLSETECDSWLKSFKAAASSIKDRDKKLTEVALSIERNLHIVGATAIEDKLQDGVPETIATLADAGINLWVLTGDKRETAIEIGYSTKVLTPKMHLTEVADGPVQRVKTLMAMEFVRLVKCGKLMDYRRSAVDAQPSMCHWRHALGQCWRSWRRFRLGVSLWWYRFRVRFCCRKPDDHVEGDMKEKIEATRDDPVVRRRAVRELAYSIIEGYLNSEEGKKEQARKRGDQGETTKHFENEEERATGDYDDESLSLSSDSLPGVFNRAESAKAVLDNQRMSGRLAGSTLRNLSIASVTSMQSDTAGLIDEDMLSLASFIPDGKAGLGDFDKRKRTILERLFAVDRFVRHGQLGKHLSDDKIASLKSGGSALGSKVERIDILGEDIKKRGSVILRDAGMHGARALVIEGAALSHLLGDPKLEEMLFAVASACDSVIACRVSPKQKALLVRLVRKYVLPTPVTLAIGDGANDVGMIQEAHVGIGISGLEGQQAVNASDFAIAQFRFLRDLLLIHGRWNYSRLAKVALYSFYKNALMAGTMIVFQSRCLFSGTPLYDQWVVSSLNFVAGFPILFTGLFDRDLEKDYVRRNPIVYESGPNNEPLTLRITLRWILLTVVHLLTIYYLSGPSLSDGGGITSAFVGLMSNEDPEIPGDGEGGDLKVFGTVIYANLIFTLAYKVSHSVTLVDFGRILLAFMSFLITY